MADAATLAKRGRVRSMTREQALQRARRMLGEGGRAIRYSMEPGHNGGADPDAFDPATHWRSPVLKLRRATCDCVGYQTWSLGFDRMQPDFAPLWDWANTDSMILEAHTRMRWFEIISWPESACLIVYPSIDYDRDGSRDRIGHVGMVTGMVDGHGKLLSEFEWNTKAPPYHRLRVAHCSASNDRQLGRAIVETDGAPWAGRDYFRGHRDPRWASIFMRYRRFVVS
jgi:hypothetical protein